MIIVHYLATKELLGTFTRTSCVWCAGPSEADLPIDFLALLIGYAGSFEQYSESSGAFCLTAERLSSSWIDPGAFRRALVKIFRRAGATSLKDEGRAHHKPHLRATHPRSNKRDYLSQRMGLGQERRP